MSNNAAVAADGGEIGRAQALQARAAGLVPSVDMNPILLKPETEPGAKPIVQGKRLTSTQARDYRSLRPRLLSFVLESFHRLHATHDLVLVEAAGSPAEVSLRVHDIANMGFARAAEVPVVTVGGIDRGGVIAQIVGTQAVLDRDASALIAGFLLSIDFVAPRACSKPGILRSKRGPGDAAMDCAHGSAMPGDCRPRMHMTFCRSGLEKGSVTSQLC